MRRSVPSASSRRARAASSREPITCSGALFGLVMAHRPSVLADLQLCLGPHRRKSPSPDDSRARSTSPGATPEQDRRRWCGPFGPRPVPSHGCRSRSERRSRTGRLGREARVMSELRPFTVDVPTAALDDLRRRLDAVRTPDQPVGAGWEYGVTVDHLGELVRRWREDFDWYAVQEALNAWPQVLTTI